MKVEYARTAIIAFIIVGLLGTFVPKEKRLFIFGPVALTLLLGLLFGKYRQTPFGHHQQNPPDEQHPIDQSEHSDNPPTS